VIHLTTVQTTRLKTFAFAFAFAFTSTLTTTILLAQTAWRLLPSTPN
jgi:hypothetical protein